jgi:hypothetical protein
MNNIPFSKSKSLFSNFILSILSLGDYTRRSYTYDGVVHHGGALNIVERLPTCLVKPDLGPKLYIAYSEFKHD